jgi:glycine/sarcosine/betaine reductase complex component A
MEPDNQKKIKEIAEANGDNNARKVIVVLGASDLEGALISAETVTSGDPSFAGPLAGVSLGLPVYHILEPDMKEVIPADIYEEEVGIWLLSVDTESLGKEFKAIREKANT